jgi:hypothetical protein
MIGMIMSWLIYFRFLTYSLENTIYRLTDLIVDHLNDVFPIPRFPKIAVGIMDS